MTEYLWHYYWIFILPFYRISENDAVAGRAWPKFFLFLAKIEYFGAYAVITCILFLISWMVRPLVVRGSKRSFVEMIHCQPRSQGLFGFSPYPPQPDKALGTRLSNRGLSSNTHHHSISQLTKILFFHCQPRSMRGHDNLLIPKKENVFRSPQTLFLCLDFVLKKHVSVGGQTHSAGMTRRSQES